MVARARWGRIHHVQPSLAGGAVAVACENIRLIDDRTAVMDLLDETDGGLVCPVAVHLEDHTALHVAGGGLARGQVDPVRPGRVRRAVPAARRRPGADQPSPPRTAWSATTWSAPAWPHPAGRPPPAPACTAPSALAELRTNTLTGEPFHWLRLRVHPGIDIDVAAPASTLPAAPPPATACDARAVLTGRLDLQPDTLQKGRAPAQRSA